MGDFPGGLVVRIRAFTSGARVISLVGKDPTSHTVWPKKRKRKRKRKASIPGNESHWRFILATAGALLKHRKHMKKIPTFMELVY